MPSIHFKALKDHAEALLADARADIKIEEQKIVTLLHHIEELGIVALGIHPEPKPAADANAAFPAEPALSASPEGVLVEGAGVVSNEHIGAVQDAANSEGATSGEAGPQ